MAEKTGIAWTDATQNFWEGCTKVGPGCDHCYAENRDKRFHEGQHWGPGAPRRRMALKTFLRPLAWDRAREAYDICQELGGDWPLGKAVPPLWVFTLSLGDFFDNAVDPAWREEAWGVIAACYHLRWQIVTKRIGNVAKMLPADWGDGSRYRHVGIIATVVTQEEANRDTWKAMALKRDQGVRWVGLSVEPQLGPINLRNVGLDMTMSLDALTGEASHLLGMKERLPPLDWVITGGESQQGPGHAPRPYCISWADQIVRDCEAAGVPCFVKQLGDNPTVMCQGEMIPFTLRNGRKLQHAGGVIEEWPKGLRVRQMPRVYDAQG